MSWITDTTALPGAAITDTRASGAPAMAKFGNRGRVALPALALVHRWRV